MDADTFHNNSSLLRAFFEWDKVRGYSASNIVDFEPGHYRVSREILVPVSPLSVIRENGRFVTIFVCGWNNLSLSLVQRRLLRTIYEDAFLSLTDYVDSPAEFIFFPQDRNAEVTTSSDGTEPNQIIRSHEVWNRNDYDMLGKSDVTELLQIFLQGREDARAILQDMAAEGRFKKTSQEPSAPPKAPEKSLFE